MSMLTDSLGRKNRKGLTIDIRGDSEVLQVTEPGASVRVDEFLIFMLAHWHLVR